MTANTPPVSPSRGEVYWADLKPATGHEQGGQPRPVIVLSVNTFNHGPAQMAVIVPTTTTIRPIPLRYTIQPPEGGLTMPTSVCCDHVRSISTLRLRQFMGAISPTMMQEIERRIRRLLGLL